MWKLKIHSLYSGILIIKAIKVMKGFPKNYEQLKVNDREIIEDFMQWLSSEYNGPDVDSEIIDEFFDDEYFVIGDEDDK